MDFNKLVTEALNFFKDNIHTLGPFWGTVVSVVITLVSGGVALGVLFVYFKYPQWFNKKKDQKINEIVDTTHKNSENTALQIQELVNKMDIMIEKNSYIYEVIRKIIGSVSVNQYKIIIDALVSYFIKGMKKDVYNYLENKNEIVENFFKTINSIEQKFDDIIITHSLEFIINDTSYQRIIRENIKIILTEFLSLRNKELIEMGKPELINARELKPEYKAKWDFLIDNLEKRLKEELLKEYEEFISKDWSLLYLKIGDK